MAAKGYFSRIKSYVNANPTKALRMALGLWCAYELVLGLYGILSASRRLTYQSYAISDWMINYQGGFVRRGLVGEVLYQLYLVHPYPLRLAICLVISTTFLYLFWLLYRLFQKNGWSYILFPSCALIMQESCRAPFDARKDYIMLIGAFFVFTCYQQWIINRRPFASYIVMQVVAMFLMLIHEATFFFTIPILFCDYFYRTHSFGGKGYVSSACMGLLFFLPVLSVWSIVCVCKGDDSVAFAVWDSWRSAMTDVPIAPNVGDSVAWLAKGFSDAVPFHLRGNFGGEFIPHTFLPSFPFTAYCYVAIYYVVTRMQTIDLKLNRLKPLDNVCLSNIVLMQLVFMLPMFTILSWDRGRTIPYWIVSSLFFYHFFGKLSLAFPKWLTYFSINVQAWIDSKAWLNNPWVYIAIIVTIPLSAWGPTTIDKSYILFSNL